MASNSPEPSSSTEADNVAEEILGPGVEPFCEVNYGDGNGLEYNGENFVSHFKTEDALPPVVSYGQFSMDPCSSTSTYAQVSLSSYSSGGQVTTSNENDFQEAPDPGSPQDQESFLSDPESKRADMQPISTSELLHIHHNGAIASTVASPVPGNILLREDSVESHHSQGAEPDDDLEPINVSVDHLNLQQISIINPSLNGINSLPILLDRTTLNAFIASSRSDGALTLDISSLPRNLLSNQGLTQRAEEGQYLAPDTPMPGMSSSLLPPMLSAKDILTTMIASSSTSTPSSSAGSSFPINHKQMLAQKYAAEMLGPTTSSSLISDLRDQQLIESISDRAASPYVVASSANSLIDSNSIAVYEDHVASLPSTSASQCLSMDVYSMDRGVSLVSSSRDSPESVMNSNVDFVSHPSSHSSVHNYVSSSVDLVHSHSLDHSMSCPVDSTVSPKLHQNDENIVDSSDGYNQPLDGSDNVLHSAGGDYCHIGDINSCDDGSANEAVTSVLNSTAGLDANEALSATSSKFSSHNRFSSGLHNSGDDLHCATVSSATHPDSTRSPEGAMDHSENYSLPSVSVSDSSNEVAQSEYVRPRRDLRSNRHWCDDCGTFYDKECTQHVVQLIFDKPVLSRAWASLPASYLYVNKIALDDDGEPVYGVFAKKSIPKRTQFGPIEGILVKREHLPSENFILVVEHDGVPLYLDTSDESTSNWMRFVRPADTHKEQNLVLVQQGQSLYFNTTRSINPKTELRVWYSPAYAEKYGLRVLEPTEEEKKALEDLENAWACFECNQRFSSSENLQKHLNQHDEDSEAAGGSKSKHKSRARSRLGRKGQFIRVKAAENSEGSDGKLIRRARGRPPKKYLLPSKQEDFKCDICYKSFPRNYSLQRHSIMHTGEKKFKCPICDMKFSHVYNRNRHVRKHKKNDDSTQLTIKNVKSLFRKKQGAEWVCTHCGLTFDNSSVLNLHTLTHAAEDVALNEFWDSTIGKDDGDDDKPCKCPECTQEFPNRRELIEHASVHGKILKQRCYRGIINPLKPFKCNLCYKSFSSDERLIRHYLVHGSEDSKPLQCDVCYKRFLNNSALACHIKVHSEERKFYECPICKAEFDQIVALKEHVRIHCKNGVYNCPNCHKVFDEYNQVRKHIRAFHSERRYPCDMCDKIFPRPDKLKLHMLRHSDHREFLCANCGKQFKRKDKLKEHMKRMHAPDREAKNNAKSLSKPGSKKFVPKVSPTDYHRFIYKCHTCLLGFKRRGMLVNHLAKRHPDIRPETVPELNLPILKTTRDYYCQYCEKVYKSSSKRKAHILKNHPGAELPMSNRKKGGVPEVPGLPNPTFSQTVGSITTHPHHCNWCHKQYASKAKLLQHQRKKHMDMLSLSYVANTTKVEPGCDQGTQINGQIVIEGITAGLTHEAAAVLIEATKKKIHLVDKDSLVVTTHPDGIPTADLLTQAMSELTQSLVEYRTHADFLTARLSHSTPATLVNPSPSTTPFPSAPSPDEESPDSPPPVLDSSITPLDPIQLNQLLAQYQQQQLSPSQVQQLAVVVTPMPRGWPSASTALGNYPAR